jgi:DNA-binding PadR family transcriptional regulator
VLHILFIKPMTGYELRRRLWEDHGERTSFGTLYPLLKRLERGNFIVQHSGEFIAGHKSGSIYYKVSELGFEALKETFLAFAKMSEQISLV